MPPLLSLLDQFFGRVVEAVMDGQSVASGDADPSWTPARSAPPHRGLTDANNVTMKRERNTTSIIRQQHLQ